MASKRPTSKLIMVRKSLLELIKSSTWADFGLKKTVVVALFPP